MKSLNYFHKYGMYYTIGSGAKIMAVKINIIYKDTFSSSFFAPWPPCLNCCDRVILFRCMRKYRKHYSGWLGLAAKANYRTSCLLICNHTALS